MCMRVYVSYFHCQTAGPIRLKFGMWFPSNWVSVFTACGCDNGCGYVMAAPTQFVFTDKNQSY